MKPTIKKISDLECHLDKKCGKKPFYIINEKHLLNEKGTLAHFGDDCYLEKVIGFVILKNKITFSKVSKHSIGKYEDVIKQFIK
jgi:hypothetical protein